MSKEKIKDPSKKRKCIFCQHNNFEEKYSVHLNKAHKSEMSIRAFIKNISKSLSSEQLERVKQFLIEIRKNV